MAKEDFSKLENNNLYMAYKMLENEILSTRENILDVLKNIVSIHKDIEAADHERFNMILLQKYRDALIHTEYAIFKEKWEEEEKMKKEIYKRIEEIKNDPQNRQLLYLCRKLAGAEMDMDNFLEYFRVIDYCNTREGKGAQLGLIDPLKDKGNESNLN